MIFLSFSVKRSFNGTLKNEDIRKYIGQFVGKQRFMFSLCIISQFYSSSRILKAVRLCDNKGIEIDKSKWKKKKGKIKGNNDNNNNNGDIQSSLSMKIADIHNSGQPRYQ